MKLKTVEIEGTTYAVVEDGNPVYEVDGKDVPFKAAEAKAKIKSQADELADAQAAAGDLARWQKLGDLKEVRKAVHTVAALGDDFDAGKATTELADAKAEAASLRDTVEDRDTTIASLQKTNFNLGIGSDIKGSAWIGANVVEALSEDRDTLVELYGKFIEPSENGGGHKFLDRDGKPLKIDGNAATLDQFLDHHVPKSLRKPSGANGSGDKGGDSTGGGGGGAPKHKGDFKDLKTRGEWINDNGLEAFTDLPVDPSTQPKQRPDAPAGP